MRIFTSNPTPFVPSAVEGYWPSEAEALCAAGSRLRSNRSLDFARDERMFAFEGGCL